MEGTDIVVSKYVNSICFIQGQQSEKVVSESTNTITNLTLTPESDQKIEGDESADSSPSFVIELDGRFY